DAARRSPRHGQGTRVEIAPITRSAYAFCHANSRATAVGRRVGVTACRCDAWSQRAAAADDRAAASLRASEGNGERSSGRSRAEVRRRRAPGVCAAPTAGGRYEGHVNACLGSDHMKTFWAVSVALLISSVIVDPVAARDLKDKVHVEVDNTVMEPGMAPGTYVCSGGHLHV